MPVKRAIKDKISDCLYSYRKGRGAGLSAEGKCRILLYHSIQRHDPKKDKMGLAVPNGTFYMQMKYLKENSFLVLGLTELVDIIIHNRRVPGKSAVITFDDGYKSVLTNALPVLKEFGFPATLFVNISFIENKVPAGLYWHDWDMLSWDDVKGLREAGLSIGSHALSHRRLTEMNEQELEYEVLKSKGLIESHVGGQVNTFSYPHGIFNKNVKDAVRRSKFICSCSSIEGLNDAGTDIFALRRTELSAFDDTDFKFAKKMSGCYDWLGFLRMHG
ncbi:MAG: polysaccharide deacetylase family protein [Candidatus Omnitrophica bacterium]|nr:polysaccharide deacetylase family protein [Candidatus Omnitrophota bacterium]